MCAATPPETYEPENIAHLKASIAVLGLLQPLLVQKTGGKYAVLAGGRRHAALKELVADKAAKGLPARSCSTPRRGRPALCWRSISRGEIRSCAGRLIDLPGDSRSCGLS
jgi:hypothetical protein